MSCGVGHRHGLDLALLWLWRRLAATVPISPLAWEPPYATGVALKSKKKKQKKNHKIKKGGHPGELVGLVMYLLRWIFIVLYT